jgi:hypothetical protein
VHVGGVVGIPDDDVRLAHEGLASMTYFVAPFAFAAQ